MPEVTSLHSKKRSESDLDPDHEARLIKGLKRQDADAFQDLINLHGDSIRNLVGRFMAFEQELDDVIQNTLVQVWRKIGSFRNESFLQTWIIRIAGLSKLQDELQIKMDEIEGLLSALNSVEFAEKKD